MHAASLETLAGGSTLSLGPEAVRHLVRVLRLEEGAVVEAFDNDGRTAPAILSGSGDTWQLRLLDAPAAAVDRGNRVIIYAAVPKGNRADWLVEKLSELGVVELVLLNAERSVVEPGTGKVQRFGRIAREAARQSRRAGVMRLTGPLSLSEALSHWRAAGAAGAVLTTERPGRPMAELPAQHVFVGPEGGWSDVELDEMESAGLVPARLTDSILRIETAAICAASILQVRPRPAPE